MRSCSKSLILISLFMLLKAHSIQSEEGVIAQKGIGLTAGPISGVGIAYRQYFEDHLGHHFGGGILG